MVDGRKGVNTGASRRFLVKVGQDFRAKEADGLQSLVLLSEGTTEQDVRDA